MKKTLESENVIEFTTTDGFMSAFCSFRNEVKETWANGFKIEFNGVIIHSSKTFKSFEAKLKQIVEKHNLEINNNGNHN